MSSFSNNEGAGKKGVKKTPVLYSFQFQKNPKSAPLPSLSELDDVPIEDLEEHNEHSLKLDSFDSIVHTLNAFRTTEGESTNLNNGGGIQYNNMDGTSVCENSYFRRICCWIWQTHYIFFMFCVFIMLSIGFFYSGNSLIPWTWNSEPILTIPCDFRLWKNDSTMHPFDCVRFQCLSAVKPMQTYRCPQFCQHKPEEVFGVDVYSPNTPLCRAFVASGMNDAGFGQIFAITIVNNSIDFSRQRGGGGDNNDTTVGHLQLGYRIIPLPESNRIKIYMLRYGLGLFTMFAVGTLVFRYMVLLRHFIYYMCLLGALFVYCTKGIILDNDFLTVLVSYALIRLAALYFAVMFLWDLAIVFTVPFLRASKVLCYFLVMIPFSFGIHIDLIHHMLLYNNFSESGCTILAYSIGSVMMIVHLYRFRTEERITWIALCVYLILCVMGLVLRASNISFHLPGYLAGFLGVLFFAGEDREYWLHIVCQMFMLGVYVHAVLLFGNGPIFTSMPLNVYSGESNYNLSWTSFQYNQSTHMVHMEWHVDVLRNNPSSLLKDLQLKKEHLEMDCHKLYETIRMNHDPYVKPDETRQQHHSVEGHHHHHNHAQELFHSGTYRRHRHHSSSDIYNQQPFENSFLRSSSLMTNVDEEHDIWVARCVEDYDLLAIEPLNSINTPIILSYNGMVMDLQYPSFSRKYQWDMLLEPNITARFAVSSGPVSTPIMTLKT